MNNIASILRSKNHNQHYLDRYIRFIHAIYGRCLESKTYTELHHICPKSKDMFPLYSRDSWNLIRLTAREHFIAHWMLSKAYGGSQLYAFWSMCNKQSRGHKRNGYNVTSRVYANIRMKITNEHSKTITGTKNPIVSAKKKDKVNCYDHSGNYLIVSKDEFHNREDLRGISSGNREWTQSELGRKTISNYIKGRTWLTHPITKQKRFAKPEEIELLLAEGYELKFNSYDRSLHMKTCQHCNKTIDATNFKRWHGDNCKLKLTPPQ